MTTPELTPDDNRRSLDSAPMDGTMIWLLVDYGDDDQRGCHPLANAITAWTLGFNNRDHDGVDEWKFAGWCWDYDQFTQGRGKVLAWKPIGFELSADAAQTPNQEGIDGQG